MPQRMQWRLSGELSDHRCQPKEQRTLSIIGFLRVAASPQREKAPVVIGAGASVHEWDPSGEALNHRGRFPRSGAKAT